MSIYTTTHASISKPFYHAPETIRQARLNYFNQKLERKVQQFVITTPQPSAPPLEDLEETEPGQPLYFQTNQTHAPGGAQITREETVEYSEGPQFYEELEAPGNSPDCAPNVAVQTKIQIPVAPPIKTNQQLQPTENLSKPQAHTVPSDIALNHNVLIHIESSPKALSLHAAQPAKSVQNLGLQPPLNPQPMAAPKKSFFEKFTTCVKESLCYLAIGGFASGPIGAIAGYIILAFNPIGVWIIAGGIGLMILTLIALGIWCLVAPREKNYKDDYY